MGTQPLLPPQKGAEPPPQFSAHFDCGQTAGRVKMPLRMDVGLRPEDFVLDGDPVPTAQKGGEAPLPPKCSAHVYCGQTARWINMQLGTKVGDSVLDGDPAPLPTKRVELLPNFRPMFIVAKRPGGSRCHLARR